MTSYCKAQERIKEAKDVLKIKGNSHDLEIAQAFDKVTAFLYAMGASESDITDGLIIRGVADLWDGTRFNNTFSEYYMKRLSLFNPEWTSKVIELEKNMTNYQAILKMNADEMVTFLNYVEDGGLEYNQGFCDLCDGLNCLRCLKLWLDAPVGNTLLKKFKTETNGTEEVEDEQAKIQDRR